jgi:hypothetical protein
MPAYDCLVLDGRGNPLATLPTIEDALYAARTDPLAPAARRVVRASDGAVLAYRRTVATPPRPSVRLTPPVPLCPVWAALAHPRTWPEVLAVDPRAPADALGRRALWLMDHGFVAIRAGTLTRCHEEPPPVWSWHADPSAASGKVTP